MEMIKTIISSVVVGLILSGFIWIALRLKKRLRIRKLLKERKEKATYVALFGEEQKAYIRRPYHHSFLVRLQEKWNKRVGSF